MATVEEKQAWKRIGDFWYAKDFEEANGYYTEHADRYDQDIASLRSKVSNIVKAFTRYFPNDESTLILDAAAGTGLCGEALLQCGFKGKVDALEANLAMLKKAEKKSIYRNHILFKLSPDVALPFDERTFDAIMCSGAFSANHVKAECLLVSPYIVGFILGTILRPPILLHLVVLLKFEIPRVKTALSWPEDMIKVLKPGGIIAFTSRLTPRNETFRLQLEKIIENLVVDGKAERVAVEEIVASESVLEENGESLKMKLYVYRSSI